MQECLKSWCLRPSNVEVMIRYLAGVNIVSVRNVPCWRRVLMQLNVGCQEMTLRLVSYRTTPELRSRQRLSHARLERQLPLFVQAVQCALSYLLMDALQDTGIPRSEKASAKIRKLVTRWADNFSSLTTNRRWVELADCAEQFLCSVNLVKTALVAEYPMEPQTT